MLRLNSAFRLSLRLHFTQSAKTDPLLEKLQKSTSKFHVFQLLGIHRPMLNLKHVNYAMNSLLKFQKKNPYTLKKGDHIQRHPEFVSLCSVVENNIDVLEDDKLVDFLHIVTSLQVDAHSSLVQQLVTEGWRRLQRLDLLSLSKFAACLKMQKMTTSPLMGQIASIVDSSLDDVEDPLILATLLYSLYNVSSPDLQERMVEKAMVTIEKLDASHFDTVLQLLDLIKVHGSNFTLLKKCDKFLTENFDSLDSLTICSIMKLYESVSFTNQEFCVAAKARLTEEVDHCDHPDGFADFFVVLRPTVSLEISERLEKKVASLADQMSLKKLHEVMKLLILVNSSNTALIQTIYSQLWKHLEELTSDHLYTMAKSFLLFGSKDDSLLTELNFYLKRHLLSSFIPSSISKTMEALFVLDPYQNEEVILSKFRGTLAQMSFYNLNCVSSKVKDILQHNEPYREKNLLNLLQEINSCKLNKINEAKCLDSLLLQMKDTNKYWYFNLQDDVAEAFINACQRLIHQLNWKNVTGVSVFLMQLKFSCPVLQDRIATIVIDSGDKLTPISVVPILRAFNYLNQRPPQGKEFYDACAQKILNNMDYLSPYLLVGAIYHLALARYLQEDLIKVIFNTNFLQRFDAQVDAFSISNRIKSRFLLLELNRYICLEHPEYGVPWFHEQYFETMEHTGPYSNHKKIANILNEIFGGMKNYVRMCVKTPYCYFIDLEFILDKEGKPIAYEENDALEIGSSLVHEHDSQLQENRPLPAGAQRYAVKFLSRGAFLTKPFILKGSVEKEKRHLEILGYHVIQVPLFLWNEQSSLKTYLREKIYADACVIHM